MKDLNKIKEFFSKPLNEGRIDQSKVFDQSEVDRIIGEVREITGILEDTYNKDVEYKEFRFDDGTGGFQFQWSHARNWGGRFGLSLNENGAHELSALSYYDRSSSGSENIRPNNPIILDIETWKDLDTSMLTEIWSQLKPMVIKNEAAARESLSREAKAQSDYYKGKADTGRIGYGLSSQPRMRNESVNEAPINEGSFNPQQFELLRRKISGRYGKRFDITKSRQFITIDVGDFNINIVSDASHDMVFVEMDSDNLRKSKEYGMRDYNKIFKVIDMILSSKKSVNEAEFKHISGRENKIKLAIKDVEKQARLKANRDKPLEYAQLSLNKIMLSKVLGREELGKEHQGAWEKLKKEYNLNESVNEGLPPGYAKFLVSLQTLIGDIAPNAWGNKSQIRRGDVKRIHNSLKKRYGGEYEKFNDLLKTQKGQFGNWYLKESVNEGKEWSPSEQKMANQITRYKKEGLNIFRLPMKTQEFYRKHQDKFEESVNEGYQYFDGEMARDLKGDSGVKFKKGDNVTLEIQPNNYVIYGPNKTKIIVNKRDFRGAIDQYIIYESVNEMDMNDPIMMKMRAAKDKKPDFGKAYGDAVKTAYGNDKNAKKLAFLKKERAQLMRDMEQEAEPEGGPIADEYGSKLNRIDAAIAKLSGRKEMTYDQAIAEATSQYPNFEVDRNIKYQDTVISKGYWVYTDTEQGGKGVYRNLMNDQILGFSKDDFDIFRKHLSSHFDIIESLDETIVESVNEAKLSTIHNAAKQGNYPVTMVVTSNGKVIKQELVGTPEIAPAAFNQLQKEYPNATISIEDRTGKILFTEPVNEEKPGLWSNIRAKKKRGEKPAHGNSKAHKTAVKAGKKINSLKEKEGVPHYTKDGKEWKGKMHKMPDDSLMSGNPHDVGGSGPNGKSEKLFHKEDLNEIEDNGSEEKEFDAELMAAANGIAATLGKELKAKQGDKEQLDEAVITSIIAAVLTGNALIGFISKMSKKLAKKLKWKKGEDFAGKINKWAHDNEKAFQTPIKRVLKFFIKDEAKLEATTQSIYAIIIMSMAAGYGVDAVNSLSKASWFKASIASLKGIAKSDEAIATAYPVIKSFIA